MPTLTLRPSMGSIFLRPTARLQRLDSAGAAAKSFAFATHRKDLSAAFVFYGPGPADVTSITAPVYGFYAGNDARIGATLPDTVAAMKAAGKTYEPVTYDGAGHGFMRAGEDPNNTVPGNKTAREQGFARLVKLLKEAKSAASSPNSESSDVLAKASAPQANSCHDSDKPPQRREHDSSRSRCVCQPAMPWFTLPVLIRSPLSSPAIQE